MTCDMYDRKTLEDSGKAAGKLLSILHTNHNVFWLTLAENTHPQIFHRVATVITIFIACIVHHIYHNLWTLLFGNLTPLNGIFGFINIFMYTIIGYIIGFEGGFYYSKKIRKLVDTRELINDLPKILKQYTYEVKEVISKPIKKRSKGDNDLDKKSL